MGTKDSGALRYATGEVAEVGDAVLIEHGRTPGELYLPIFSEDQLKEWGVGEPGFMISAQPFGLVFWPQANLDPVVFVARKDVSR